MINRFSKWMLLLGCIIIVLACESEKRIPPRGYIPASSIGTEQLEASYFWLPQDQLNSPYWKDAPFLKVSLVNVSTENLPGDGYLNTTGTYAGLEDFNRGADPELSLKAGYDAEYIYIMLEWKDTTTDASLMTRVLHGYSDPLKNDSSGGWTSQKNQDSFQLLFDLDDNTKDVWKWGLAATAPFDMALNLSSDAQGIVNETNESLVRNGPEDNSRAAPEFFWNGERQEITLPNGTRKLLDPAYYLLDDFKTPVPGSFENGQKAFNNSGDCKFCHGLNGNGDVDPSINAGALNGVFTNRYSREALIEFIGSSGHEGGGSKYFGKIENNPETVRDLITFMRGIAGQPGYSLLIPEEEAEIIALSNVGTGSISLKNSSYKVLLRRKLVNEHTEDVQFDPAASYTFSIRLTDNDNINFIGASDLELIFKSNEL